MRSRVARLVLPFAVVAIVGACAGAQETQTPVVDAAAITATVDSLEQGFVALVAARDTEGVVAYYTDDARMLPAGGPRLDGREAIRALWVQFLNMPNLELSITTRDCLVSQAGDMATQLGAYTMKWTDPKGKPVEDVGKYVTIYTKTDAGWKVIVDIFNSDRQPAM